MSIERLRFTGAMVSTRKLPCSPLMTKVSFTNQILKTPRAHFGPASTMFPTLPHRNRATRQRQRGVIHKPNYAIGNYNSLQASLHRRVSGRSCVDIPTSLGSNRFWGMVWTRASCRNANRRTRRQRIDHSQLDQRTVTLSNAGSRAGGCLFKSPAPIGPGALHIRT